MILEFLYNLIIEPLVYLYEYTFNLSYKILYVLKPTFRDSIFVSIVLVSVLVNLLSFPLYAAADKMQQEEKDKQKKIGKYVEHIKKTFSGDERYFMLSAYYRTEHYSPVFQLRQALPLLLQIPFFTAAYIFFVNCRLLSGARITFLHFINNLFLPDGILNLNNISINILPIIMTIVNIISAMIYTQGLNFKDKIQPIILAIIFLVLLYNAPSGLVIYWILNNLFSLFKSIYSKMNFKKIVNSKVVKSYDIKNSNSISKASLLTIFVLLGMLIPSNIIVSSPSEFIINGNLPYDIILNNIIIYFGFSLWGYLVYYMTPNKFKPYIAAIYFAISIYFILNHFTFINNLGTLTENLKYTKGFIKYTSILIKKDMLLVAVSLISLIVILRFTKFINWLPYIIFLSILTVSVINFAKINFQLNDYLTYESKTETISKSNFDGKLKLSKNGKNVIVIMFDRSCGKYFNFVLGDRKEFFEVYDGFTFYENTVSAAGGTIVGSTALFGGYDYLPQNANKRSDVLLVDKQNEALSIMPYNFHQNGYDCIVSNLPYENYYMGDREPLFKNMSRITYIDLWANNEMQLYENLGQEKLRENQKHNFIMYSLMKVTPIAFKGLVYGDGRYFSLEYVGSLKSLGWWYALENLVNKSSINNDNSNNFWLISNELTHNEDNVIYPYGTFSPIYNDIIEANSYPEIYDRNGNKFDGFLPHLSTEITAYNQFAKFLEYLKDNDIYDNTRIIITSDHGTGGEGFDYAVKSKGGKINVNPIQYNSSLLFKDFNSRGTLKISDEFMSNADTPYMAFDNLITKPVNPFLHKDFTTLDKTSITEIDIYSGSKGFNASNYIKDYTFNNYVASVSKGDIFDLNNWFYKNEVK